MSGRSGAAVGVVVLLAVLLLGGAALFFSDRGELQGPPAPTLPPSPAALDAPAAVHPSPPVDGTAPAVTRPSLFPRGEASPVPVAAEEGAAGVVAAPENATGSVVLRAVASGSGEPLPSARWCDSPEGVPEGEEGGEADAEGRLGRSGLAPGRTRLYVGAPGRGTRRLEFQAILRGEVDLGAVALSRAGALSAVVRDFRPGEDTGRRVKVIEMPGWEKFGKGRIDGNGRIHLTGIRPGVVLVETEALRDRYRLETVEIPEGETLELDLGGEPSLAGTSVYPDGRRPAFVAAVPAALFADPLAAIGPLADLQVAGVRVVEPGEDGSYDFPGIPPGNWVVGNEIGFARVRIEEGAAEPVRQDILPLFLNGRLEFEGGAGPERVTLTAVPEGVLEPALRGNLRCLLDVVLAAWRGEGAQVPVGGEGAFSIPVLAEGPHLVFCHAAGFAAEGPLLLEGRSLPSPPSASLLLHPAARVRVNVADAAPREWVAVAARDARGTVAAFRASIPPVDLSLLPGSWRIEVLRGGGRRVEREIFVPPTGEIVVEAGPP